MKLEMTNKQINQANNFTPQTSFLIAPQHQQMIVPNLKQQPLIAALNPQIPQLQPIYIIAGGSNMPVLNPYMYQFSSAIPMTNVPMQFMYYQQTFRSNPVSTSRQIQLSNSMAPEPLVKIEKKTKEKPPVLPRQKSKEYTMLYRYQKPITVDELKHPNDKYKDLIYRPRFITSKSIDPPTEELVPKLDERTMTPLIEIKSRINLTPLSNRPVLVENLKPPVEKVESEIQTINKLPTLVEDLKLPIDKAPEIKPEVKKIQVKSELVQVPDPDLFKFIESTKNSLNYIGKFHYPPEVDYNDVTDINEEFNVEKIENLEDNRPNRPKSVFVN